MNTYQLSSRSLPLDSSWDVIVVGGGPAGCSAAIAAAREGAKTLLVESTGCLGGAGTSALVPAWCPFSDKEKIIYRGLAEKIFEAAKKGIKHIQQSDLDWVPIDSERLKRVYDQFVTESGATVLFHTVLSAVEMAEPGEVSALIVSNKTGLSALRAKVYIDATGDADLAAWAGAEFLKGDENGDVQPSTHCFVLANVDETALQKGPCLYGGFPESPIHAILASGRYPEITDDHLCSNLVGPGTIGFNAGHVFQVDSTNPQSVSQALITGRKMAMAYRDALAEFFPSAFGNAFLVSTGSVVGIRESRRVIGDYILSVEDYLARRSFEDEICRNSYFIDIHYTQEESRRKGIDVTKRFERYGPGESHGVPYRCLTPKGLKNVLVAGRSISCERAVQGSVRVMPVCLAMGEAAGIASVYAANTDAPHVHAVDANRLRARLREMNAYLP